MTGTRFTFNRRGVMGLFGGLATSVACACGKARAQPITGEERSAKSTVLGMGADMLQSKGPIDTINMYLNGYHFYADDMGRQIEAHHYCSHVNEDFFQCVIDDDNKEGARLIGIEYIVAARILNTLPAEEKRLWHSHRHETTSGELVMPGIPRPVEHTAIAMLVKTYGKTWHTWQVDRDSRLPIGIPQLMMGFTTDGQLSQNMIQDRDRRLGTETADTRRSREDLAKSSPPVAAGADGWTKGQSPQLVLTETPLQNRRG